MEYLKELPNARFNDTGLLGNEFHEVDDFACQIQGKGEPVEWIPCRIRMYVRKMLDTVTEGGKKKDEDWERATALEEKGEGAHLYAGV